MTPPLSLTARIPHYLLQMSSSALPQGEASTATFPTQRATLSLSSSPLSRASVQCVGFSICSLWGGTKKPKAADLPSFPSL